MIRERIFNRGDIEAGAPGILLDERRSDLVLPRLFLAGRVPSSR
jgi:hypothetical protein